ncbi:MAG: outer membrane protein assembly factor BamA [Rhodospirillales bacterium]|nr:outer membrane protein assembly factor BamA [Rhodospirillales bacterium]
MGVSLRRLVRIISIISIVLGGFYALPAASQSGKIVSEIVVEGAQRIEPGTVRSYLLIQEGDTFDRRRIDRSLKSLFATGLFADVSLREDGTRLIVKVVENPVINRIAFEGNKRIEDDELDAEISLRPRVIYTRTKVQNDVKRILTLYRRNGRFAAAVEPKVIQQPQNRVDLVFEINEGKLTEVRNVRFIGNREFSDTRLQEVIRTRESRWYRFLSSDDTYDPDRLTLDRELLRRFYLEEGYADFRVVSAVAELTPDRKDFFITFTMEEGSRYTFGDVDIVAQLKDLNPENLRQEIEIEKGDWYNSEEVEKAIDVLTTAVGTLGYAFVDVRPRINRNRETKTINLTVEIGEGPRVFVERIDINGNVRTADKVVRREVRLVEGDAFNASKLRRSKKNVQDLNFFEKVNVEQIPGSAADKTVVKVDVEEKSTGSLSLGAGFSTTNGALADIGIRERNLLGQGYDLKLNVTAAERKSQIDLGFTDPYFLDREVAAGFDIFHITQDLQDTSSYDSETTGGALRSNYPITDNLRQGWKYTAKVSEVTNVPSNASLIVKDAAGTNSLSEVSHTLFYDRLDSRISPTEGYYLSMGNDLAGLGGTSRYIRNSFGAGKYYPLDDQWIIGITGEFGHIFGIGQDSRLTDRFFIGGDDLRGFATFGAGPRDKSTEDALGGEWKYTATAQMKFPVGLPNEYGINGRVFTDFGSSGMVPSLSGVTIQDTGSLRASAGFGVSWISPFGPIGLDVGFPYLKEGFDVTETIRLNFGTRF